MMKRSSSSLTPRNGHTLVVGIVARISGCDSQREISNDDQIDHGKQVVEELNGGPIEGPVEYRIIATIGKGERLDRPEIPKIEAWLRSRELDLLIAEDIGRMVRGTEAARLCGIAVDHGTRVVAPNDYIDTAEEHWEEDVISACRDHVGHNTHTSKRLKHKLMNRFDRYGGAVALPIYGYVKPQGGTTYDDWQKDPDATPILNEWFLRLRENPNCSAIADWLNDRGIPPGKYCRTKRWTGAMVRRITANPILKGLPGRGFKKTVKHHESGRRIAVKNASGPHYRECPHLAHIDADLFDEVNALLNQSNQGFGRKPVNGQDPRYRVPRKRTRFPGQHARCWYCGRQFVWGGNGIINNLMCNGARECRCWNSMGFDGALAARRLVEAVTAELYRLEGFDDQFRELVERARSSRGGDIDERIAELKRKEETCVRREQNIVDQVAEFGPDRAYEQRLAEIRKEKQQIGRERRELERLQQRHLVVPSSVADLRVLLEEKFRELAEDSPEFGDLMRLMVPEINVYLVRLLDGGHPLPRARVRLNLVGVVPNAKFVDGLEQLCTRELDIDLFEPPQRERIREEAVRLRQQGLEQRQIAAALPQPPTQTAVWKALQLHALMERKGAATPYIVLEKPPEDYTKLRHHKKAKFRFEPLDGYIPPPL